MKQGSIIVVLQWFREYEEWPNPHNFPLTTSVSPLSRIQLCDEYASKENIYPYSSLTPRSGRVHAFMIGSVDRISRKCRGNEDHRAKKVKQEQARAERCYAMLLLFALSMIEWTRLEQAGKNYDC